MYALSDALKENYLNCIVRGQVLHQLWKHYCGEASLAVLADEHFFSVVRLADGSFLSLDGIPEWFTEDESVFEVGEHERLYESSVLCWKAEELREDPFNREEAIKLYKEAIRLAENDPNIKNDLAEIFAEDPATYAQAELLYKQCSHSLAELISKNPNRLAEAEKYHLEATQLAPEDPWYTASLGAFYHFTMPNLAKAKQYYTTTLQLLQRDSHALSPLTKSELEKLIVEL